MDQKDDKKTEKSKEDVDKIRKYIQDMAKDKPEPTSKVSSGPVAKEQVELKHVEIKKQEVSQETMDLAKRLKEKVLEHDHFEELSNDEITILETFMGKRLFLSRIAIIANQSRMPYGKEPFKKADLESILNSLVEKGYVESEMVNDQPVYWLTERGKYRVQ